MPTAAEKKALKEAEEAAAREAAQLSDQQTQAPAPPPVQPAAPTVQLINSDPIVDFLNRKASVVAQELTSLKTSNTSGRRDILVGGKVVFRDGRGIERVRDKTIRDVNTHLLYAWVSPDSLKNDPVFMQGWGPVKPDSEGGRGIPAHYFDSAGFIQRGESYFVWTTRENFDKSVREREQKLLNSQVSGLTSPTIEGKSDGVGQLMGVTEEAPALV